jgi:hypothetical protein
MNGYMMAALSEQRREALLRDARKLRSVPRHRSRRRPSVRSWLSAARHS